MKKTIFQGAVTAAFFVGLWFALKTIDWEKRFNIQARTDKTEQKVGDLFWDVFKKTEEENKDPEVKNTVDSIVTQICQANQIDRKKIKVHVLNKDEINALALPNHHLIVYTGLINKAEEPEELAGVICHEMAHIELNHVMKKLIKEVGLSVLVSMTTSGSGGEAIKKTVKTLSSSAFDRSLEKEADIKAVDYLTRANIDPEPFANFLFKLSENEDAAVKYMTWISTHPNSKDRAGYIKEYGKNKIKSTRPILSKAAWKQLKKKVKE